MQKRVRAALVAPALKLDSHMIDHLDHLVLTTASEEACVDFYTRVMGMRLERFVSGDPPQSRMAFVFGRQKINLHDAAAPYIPHAACPVAGSVDLCFITTQPIADWQAHFTAHNIEIEDGPVRKTGANGPMLSLYVRDPDGNLIEVSNYI